MATTDRAYLEQLLDTHRRRLGQLELQAARQGYSTPPEVHTEIEDIRAQMLALTQQLTDLLPPGHVPVDLWTRPEGRPATPAAAHLDWAAWFSPALPTPEVWRDTLLPELRALAQRLTAYNSRTIALRPKAHLSAALAFGYVFRSTTGFQVWVEQVAGQWWRTGGPATEGALLDKTEASRSAGDDTVIEVSVARDVGTAVQAYLEEHRLPADRHVRLAPPRGPGPDAVPDASHALAMAKQVRAAAEAARAARPRQTIHLFAAVPVGLAVLIGAHLNACEPVQCYEFDRPRNVYAPACLLTP